MPHESRGGFRLLSIHDESRVVRRRVPQHLDLGSGGYTVAVADVAAPQSVAKGGRLG